LKIFLTIALIWIPSFTVLADDCPLQGRWKSDAARTLADIANRDSFEADELSAVSQDLFGHVIHEWTCTEFRAYFDYSEPAEAVPYRIHDLDAEAFIVTVHGETEVELKIALEGACYKVLTGGRKFFEYFCPVRSGPISDWNKDQAWERRKQIEQLHAKTPGGRDLSRLRSALGPIRDKDSVLRIASLVLKSAPVEKDGVFRVGNIEITFDAESNLSSLSTSEGGIVIASDSAGDD
jgi:hypothetical protein